MRPACPVALDEDNNNEGKLTPCDQGRSEVHLWLERSIRFIAKQTRHFVRNDYVHTEILRIFQRVGEK